MYAYIYIHIPHIFFDFKKINSHHPNPPITGIEGLRACCYAKAVTDDRTSLIQTWIPGPLQYPIKGVSEGFGLALIRLSYAQSPLGFVKALFALMCLKEKK